ncbi:hypothetical protein FPV67DRAFT_1450220 [Lyophyllum atratum]|nr:hypothetical protein FPV67DRAFT_1450220 [Lyophyllum atratum]
MSYMNSLPTAQRFKEWYSNNSKARKVSKTPALTFQFDKPKPTRAPQAIKVYSKGHYKEKVKDSVKAEMADKGIIPKLQLPVIRCQLAEAFAAESAEVQQAVLAEVQTAKATMKLPQVEPTYTPQSYAVAIDCVPEAARKFIDVMSLQTGWVWSVLGGGPDPVNHGRIRTVGYHYGKSHIGHSFKEAHGTYNDTIQEPYGTFVQSLYSENVCNAGALVPDPKLGSYTMDSMDIDLPDAEPPSSSV